jgi:hypothetical protein
MTDRPVKVIYDCETQTETVIELTDEEIAHIEQMHQESLAEQEALENERLAKEAAKASALVKLAELGLTEEEANALIN